MIAIRDIEQGSRAWFESHAGIPSAGCAEQILTATGKESSRATAYIETLTEERKNGTMQTGGVYSSDMRRGHEMEPVARGHFQKVSGLEVEQVGMVYTDDMKFLCSPDGLIVGKKEGLEIKCPREKTHLRYMEDDKLPAKYFPQVQSSMWCCGYKFWWFLSFYPGLPDLLIKVERDDAWCMKLVAALHRFNQELDAAWEEMQGR